MKKAEPRIEYWDSCLFIEILTGQDQNLIRPIREMIRGAEAGDARIVISTFVIAEVRPRDDYDESARKILARMFDTDRPYMRIVAVTRRIAKLTHEIAARHPALTVPDCIHVATAIHAQAAVMFTLDGEKAKRRRSRHLLGYDGKIGDPALSIRAPKWEHGPLFSQPAPSSAATPPSKDGQ